MAARSTADPDGSEQAADPKEARKLAGLEPRNNIFPGDATSQPACLANKVAPPSSRRIVPIGD
jgi:hypothetical protein